MLGIPAKKLNQIVYYERYVVVQPGVKEDDGIQSCDLLTEEEYLNIEETLPKDNHLLPKRCDLDRRRDFVPKPAHLRSRP